MRIFVMTSGERSYCTQKDPKKVLDIPAIRPAKTVIASVKDIFGYNRHAKLVIKSQLHKLFHKKLITHLHDDGNEHTHRRDKV